MLGSEGSYAQDCILLFQSARFCVSWEGAGAAGQALCLTRAPGAIMGGAAFSASMAKPAACL